MTATSLTQLVQLFTLADAETTQRLTTRLSLVLSDPTAYQAQHAEELAERGIVAALPAQELRDIALIDGLLSADLLWEFDWKETAAEMAEGFNEILTQQRRQLFLRPATMAHRHDQGPEALDAVQEALEPLGLALVFFSLDSDSYPLGVVADAQAAELRRLAAELGFTLTVY